MQLPISRIKLNGGTQPRAAMHEPTITEYTEAIEEGVKLPPVTVFFDGEQHWLADGFHRVGAHVRAGLTEIEADVRQGSRRDAMLFSFAANATHGLPRTSDDKRRVVQAMLTDPDWSQWSNRKIARACLVGSRLVDKMRPTSAVHLRSDADSDDPPADDPAPNPPTRRKVERGEQTYEMDVTKPKRVVTDPDEALERELAEAEEEAGGAEARQLRAEVETLRSQLAAAQETIADLTAEIEHLVKGVDGDMAIEIRKQAVYIRSVEKTRDDWQQQCALLKREVTRLSRRVGATEGVHSHA